METPSARARRVALIALGATGALAAAKIAVWIATGSLAVLSQALDSAVDIVALGLLYVGLRIAAKPADATHHYGHAKAEHLVVFTQMLFLGVIVVVVAITAIVDLGDSAAPPSTPWYAFAILGGSVAIDVARIQMLRSAAREADSDALRAGALNLATDVGTAGVVLISLGFVRAGSENADGIGALLVAVAVAAAAWRLGRRAVNVLMDHAPQRRVDEIQAAAAAAPGVAETRRVRVRTSGSQLFADVTVAAGRTASLERAHDIAESVENAIAEVAPGADVVVHVEPVSETSGFVERVQAAASRTEGVHEVHNVLVHAFDERGTSKLHVTFHAKVAAALSLAEAHDLSDRLESAVKDELGQSVRVDSHIEPLESTELGRDVTSQRADVVEAVTSLATDEPDVLDCHEVIVTSARGHLAVVAHVHARHDLPLQRIHEASDRIENAVRAQLAEVGAVVIHFEPMEQKGQG